MMRRQAWPTWSRRRRTPEVVRHHCEIASLQFDAELLAHFWRAKRSRFCRVLAGEAANHAKLEQWAWRRVNSLRLLYNHATVYVIGNFVILLIDLSTPGVPWFYDILLGWGLFLGLHALHAYELVSWSTLDWEQRTVRKLIEHRLHK